MAWTWDPATATYTGDAGTLDARTLLELRDDFTAAQEAAFAATARRAGEGALAPADFLAALVQQVRDTHIAQYLLGRGGQRAMGATDWTALSQVVAGQVGYARGFVNDLAAGKLSADAVVSRAALYSTGGIQSFERGHAAGRGVPDLPTYPGDGTTPCVSRCRCSWAFDAVEGGWNCWWEASATGVCAGCSENAARYNPLFLPASR